MDNKENAVGQFSDELKIIWEFYDKEKKGQSQQEDEKRRSDVANKFQDFFGAHFTPDPIGNDIVEIDGKRLRYIQHARQDTWQVSGACPKCGENTWSTPMGNTHSVAAMMYGDFEPDGKHVCSSPKPTSTGDQLVTLIQSIVRENAKS